MSLAHPFISFSRKGAFFILFLSGLLLLLLAVLSLLVPAAHAGQVTVTWDPNPEPEVAGYKIYYGTSAGSYTSSLDAGNATSILISGLQDGATYFFSAVAYDASLNESGFSNEITYSVESTYSVPEAAVAAGESSSGGGACFIATAAYGSGLAPEVSTLREFRDRYLLTNGSGQAFVDWYYRVSPPAAAFIAKHESLKTAVRWTLAPVVYAVKYPAAALTLVLLLPAGAILRGTLCARRRSRVVENVVLPHASLRQTR